VQSGIKEITEEYEEALHGPIDAPMVSANVHAQRQRFGTLRTDAEAAALEADMRKLRDFAAGAHARQADSAGSAADASGAQQAQATPNASRAGASERSAPAHDPFAADSDDEDAEPLPAHQGGASTAPSFADGAASQQSSRASAQQSAVPGSDAEMDSDALEAELARLEAAFVDASPEEIAAPRYAILVYSAPWFGLQSGALFGSCCAAAMSAAPRLVAGPQAGHRAAVFPSHCSMPVPVISFLQVACGAY
jgi:hypothetical protein